jgi:hypothetical protein
VGIGVLAQDGFGDSLDRDQVETAIIVLLVLCGIGMVVVLRTVTKATTRLLLLGIIFILGIGLWWQREELEDCKGQCSCHVFGLDVDIPDPVNQICPR